MPSIRAYLTAFLVIPLAIATGVVAFVAQRIAHNAVEQYAVSILESDAQGKRDAIMALLQRRRTAGAYYLENAEANCNISGMSNVLCAREGLAEFTAHEGAKCAILQTPRVRLAAHNCRISQTASETKDFGFTSDGSSYAVTARNAEFASVLRAEYSSQDLYRILAGGEFGVSNSSLRLGSSGQVLSAPSAPRFVTALGCSSTLAQDTNGRRFMVRSEALPMLGGCVISHIPERQALASSLAMRRVSWLMVAGFALTALLLAYGAATLLSRPIAQLTDRAVLLQEGDFDAPVPTSGPSEIRKLGSALSEAAAALKVARETELERARAVAAAGMAASLAHQINNPLTSVTSALSILDQSVQDAAGRKILGLATQDARRIAGITRQLIALHRESHAPELVCISSLLQSVVEQQRSEIEQRRIDVRQELSKVSVTGFESELRHAFANILQNAVAAATSGTAIVIRCGPARELRQPCRPGARITFHDVGPGVDPSLRVKLMQPFISSSPVRGKGLGLWVANAAVQKHHGRLRVRSGARRTSVSVFLPQIVAEST